ncbi:MAG: M23 family metallopeptidase [Anaerolineae bacterium]|nr:M23 family metallopeptidase [Anaerolineae bacterium]
MSTPFDRRILWVHWEGEAVRESSVEALADHIRRETPNVAGVVLKTSHGPHWQGTFDQRRALAIYGPDTLQRWVQVLNDRRLEAHAWCVVQAEDIARESETILAACRVPGIQSMLLQVDAGAPAFNGGSAQATRDLIARIRAGIRPDFHLGLNFDAREDALARIHLQEWLPHVQSLHPMVFHWEFGEGQRGPEEDLDVTFGTLARYGLPVVPMLQTYPTPAPLPEEQVTWAGQYAFAKGAVGITYFRYGADSSASQIVAGVCAVEPQEPPTDEPRKRVFQVRALRLRARESPTFRARTLATLALDSVIEVDAKSRMESDGYVWWCGRQGWLPQGRSDQRQVLMIDLTPDVPPYGLPLLANLDAEAQPALSDAPQKRFRVMSSMVHIRSQPDLDHEFLTGATLQRGAEIVVDADAWVDKNGFRWWFHGPGWSAELALDSGLAFMQDLTPEVARIGSPLVEDPEPEPPADSGESPVSGNTDIPFKRFQALGRLKVRSQPGLAQRAISSVLQAGEVIQPRADAWRELDGYVWWQHGTGWSAERSLDQRKRYMEDLTPDIARVEPGTPTPAPLPVPTVPWPKPLPTTAQRYWVVALGVTIRDEPNTNAIRTGRLRQGEELLINPASEVEADGYIWVRHADGWSTVRSLDGKEENMLNIDALPLIGTLFQQTPVRLEDVEWAQYYGNTSFAYRYGKKKNYDSYSQGLHGGLDLGKLSLAKANPPVFAAVEGLFDGRGKKFGPNRVDVLVGDYRIIYGHVGSPANLARRTSVIADTVMGVIENTQYHTHIEVRYRNRYILNPLLLMPPALVEEFVGRFPPEDSTFVQTSTWNRWLTPLDQPVIRLGGEVIGPRG